MTFGIIIQARVKAHRLPSKLLLPFYKGKTVLDLIIERLISFTQKCKIKIPIILATSTNKADTELIKFAQKYKIHWFRGDEQNVLKRYVDCCDQYDINNVIRICADNPFFSTKYLRTLLSFVATSLTDKKLKYDYISFTLDNKIPSIKEHIGLFAEYTTLSALRSTLYSTTNPLYLEHVTNYLYTHPHNYNIYLIYFEYNPITSTLKYIRLTLDTIEDFTLLQELYSSYIDNNYDPEINIKNIIQLLKPDHYETMKQQIELHSK
jgi:spore coat polysaccharide biosynthesis protein SpsF